MAEKTFRKLLEPVSIGNMVIRNRIVMPPMLTGLAQEEGYATERSKAYYEARAKGGAGLIVVEITAIQAAGRTAVQQLSIGDDRFIHGLSQIARAIKSTGARAAIQLHHAGRNTSSRIAGTQPVGPSPIPLPGMEIPRELTVDEIAKLVTSFAQAADRAKKAGFDGVEIHGAHAYLLAQFLSPASNRRKDAYGGRLENRARFLLEVIGAVRKTVGRDFPVWCRLNGEESEIDGGIAIEEARETAIMAAEAGVDAIHITAHPPIRPMFSPTGWGVHLAAAVKQTVSVPVIAVGKLTPELAERVLAEGKADLVSIGRPLIADPELPNKLASGRPNDIRPCLYCLICVSERRSDGSTRCTVNASTGREGEYTIFPAEGTKRVTVVGGGPAGMEAARIAALRGHKVQLYERESRLGGQLNLASVPPLKEDVGKYKDYLVRQIEELGIRVNLGKEATVELILESRPDAVVVATGATQTLSIPGLSGANVVNFRDVLEGRCEVGGRVIVIGGGLVGCETALYLAEQGKVVTIVEMLDEIASKVTALLRPYLLDELANKGIVSLVSAKCAGVTGDGLVISQDGSRRTLAADTIVVAVGARPNRQLYDDLQGRVSQLYVAGDASDIGRIIEAIYDGFQIGREL